MTCKRQGEARSDLHTLPGASRVDNIRCGCTQKVAHAVLMTYACKLVCCIASRAMIASVVADAIFRRAVFGAAVAKNVVPFELTRGGGAAGGTSDDLHCEVEVSDVAFVCFTLESDLQALSQSLAAITPGMPACCVIIAATIVSPVTSSLMSSVMLSISRKHVQ